MHSRAKVASAIAAWQLLLALLSTVSIAEISRAADDDPATVAAAAPQSQVLCLRTEYFTIPEAEEGMLPFRLVRELGRQSVLIAARDQLALSTRDETLGEVFPAAVVESNADLAVKVRCYFDGTVRIHLSRAGNDRTTPIDAPVPKQPKAYDTDSILVKLTESLEAHSRNEFVDCLRELNFSGQTPQPNEANQPGDAVEGLLLQMDFVSQFAAVRQAHAAIREQGQSAAWLGVLARGYAHLALMTEHHWKSDNEAFAARALLYAERMVQADSKNVVSRAHRAYARAVVGLHAAALRELDEIQQLQADRDNPASLPAWVELIEPFCNFEREPVLAVGELRPSLRPLAQRLSFEQHRAFGDDRWLLEAARRTAEVCPEEYGVFAALTAPGASLSVSRMGAYYGPAALHEYLPRRIAGLADLPKPVRDEIEGIEKQDAQANENDGAAGEGKSAEADDAVEDDAPADTESEEDNPLADLEVPDAEVAAEPPVGLPTLIARQFVAEPLNDADTGEPSWSALGALIAEEQFVQAAIYLKVATNATESSLAEIVAALRPVVKAHRYARHIEAYAVNKHRESRKFYEVLGDMQFVDARGNMAPMFNQTWRALDENGQPKRGAMATWSAFMGHNLTMPGMLEAYQRHANSWWRQIDHKTRKLWADNFRRTSPRSPQALRLDMAITTNATAEQVAEWEERAGEDPAAYKIIADWYVYHQLFADAFRCYEISIALSPSKDAFVNLAYAYRKAGQEELWLPTLERFFEVDALGLEHAQVHQRIAWDYIEKDNWIEAEPHALAAAETWSAWGLELAAIVTAALEKWDDSEKWIREMSTSYPSTSGGEWYFWCRRHGRGDVATARRVAEQYFTADWFKSDMEGRIWLMIYHTLENKLPAATDDAKYLTENGVGPNVELLNQIYYHLHLVLLAHDANDADLKQAALKRARELIGNAGDNDVGIADVDLFACRLIDGEKPSDAEWAEMDSKLKSEQVLPTRRCNREYFIGRAAELAGDIEHAEEYYGRALESTHVNIQASTLAGMRLTNLRRAAK